MKTLLILFGVSAWLSAFTLTMDSVTVDSVWNSDSGGVVRRDCKISFKPQGNMKAVWYVPSVSFDGGLNWYTDSIVSLDTAVHRTMVAIGAKKSFKARIIGGDRSNVAVQVTVKMPPLPTMVPITGGTFQMNISPDPVRTVTVSSFSIGRTEVTQEFYAAIVGKNPSNFRSDTSALKPIEKISWYDAALFCNALSKLTGKDTVYVYTTTVIDKWVAIDYTKNGYRLPTQAEREFCCRAGTTTKYYWGPNLTTAADTAAADSFCIWANNSYNKGSTSLAYGPQRVGSKAPNAWGLYDMNGNVFEWTNNWSGNPTEGEVDPVGPATSSTTSYKADCGGSWTNRGNNWYLRTCGASLNQPTETDKEIGMRLVTRP